MNHARISELELQKAEAVEFLQICARIMQVDISMGNTRKSVGWQLC